MFSRDFVLTVKIYERNLQRIIVKDIIANVSYAFE